MSIVTKIALNVLMMVAPVSKVRVLRRRAIEGRSAVVLFGHSIASSAQPTPSGEEYLSDARGQHPRSMACAKESFARFRH
jgi:hypothetical protein